MHSTVIEIKKMSYRQQLWILSYLSLPSLSPDESDDAELFGQFRQEKYLNPNEMYSVNASTCSTMRLIHTKLNNNIKTCPYTYIKCIYYNCEPLNKSFSIIMIRKSTEGPE